MSRLEDLKEFKEFMQKRKLFWLAPIFIMLLLLSLLLVSTQSSAIAPFIYTLF
jgi:uncharacterized membrane protein (DUF485 family)